MKILKKCMKLTSNFHGGGDLRKIPSVGKVLDSCCNYTTYMFILSLSVSSKKSWIGKTELPPCAIPSDTVTYVLPDFKLKTTRYESVNYGISNY